MDHTALYQIVEKIKTLPGANVDCNFGQGYEKIAAQLATRLGEEDPFVDSFIRSSKESIDQLASSCEPFPLPPDYRSFLEDFGGMTINRHQYRLEVVGVGPMVLEWYDSLRAEIYHQADNNKAIYFAVLHTLHGTKENIYIPFALDVQGVVQKDAVVSIGPDKGPEHQSFTYGHTDNEVYRVVAPSFLKWLELVFATEGLCGLERLLGIAD